MSARSWRRLWGMVAVGAFIVLVSMGSRSPTPSHVGCDSGATPITWQSVDADGVASTNQRCP